jgi:hypothetical protein
MKAIFNLLLVLSLLVWPLNIALSADSELDVYIHADDTYKSVSIDDNETIAQMFVPHKDYTTSIAPYIKFGHGEWITMKLYDHQNLKFFPSLGLRAPDGSGWLSFSLDPEIYELVPGNHYSIQLEADNPLPSWTYDILNPYDEGYAGISGEVRLETDLGLMTFGYNEEDLINDNNDGIANDNNDDDEGENDSEVVNNNEEDPNSEDKQTSQTDSTIKSPTNLSATATYSDNQPIIKLTWEESKTKNIDGYEIYRSKQKDKGFQKIAFLAGQKTNYDDKNLEYKTNYYYKIKSSKNNRSSDYSKVASATTQALEEIQSNQDQLNNIKLNQSSNNNLDDWRMILVVFLTIYLLLISSFWLTYKRYQKLS